MNYLYPIEIQDLKYNIEPKVTNFLDLLTNKNEKYFFEKIVHKIHKN
jgi:hypothetical protein